MLKTKEMVKIRISAPKNRMKRVVDALYKLRLVHLLDYTGKEFFQIGEPFQGASDYSVHLVKLNAMLFQLGIVGKANPVSNIPSAISRFERAEAQYTNTAKRISALKQERASSAHILEISEPIANLGMGRQLLSGYASIAAFVGTIRPKKDFEKKLSMITKNYGLKLVPYGNRNSIALFVPKGFEQQVRQLLIDNTFNEINIENFSDPMSINHKLSTIDSDIVKLEGRIENIKKENSQLLLDLQYTLEGEVDRLEAPLRFATSLNSFYLEGWIPKADAQRLQNELKDATQKKIYVELFSDAKGAPIAFNNPKGVDSFEFFLNLYSLPKAIEIDPSFFVFLTFPLFFGFMLGDVGYGIATVVAAFLMRNLFGKQWRMLMGAMIISGFATILFGFIFGEFFGFEFVAQPLLHRAHDVDLMLLIAILVGAVHVNISLLIGFYNKLMQYGFKPAFLEKISWIIMELGVIIIALEQFGMVSLGGNSMYLGGGVAILGIGLIYMGEGINGLVELPALLSNIVSYARLFAIGLASVAFALIINKFATEFIAQGGFMIVAAIIILILGHLVNLAVGVLGSFLQSLRLHYVEFFNHFFEGGGVRYVPFGEREK